MVGVLLVLGLLPGTEPVGTSNLLGQGGFAPEGWGGIAAGLLVVVFAFGGIEIVTIAAAEAREPRTAVARATRSIVWRILVFYLGSVAIMVLVLPWDSPLLAESPFVAVLGLAGLPARPASWRSSSWSRCSRRSTRTSTARRAWRTRWPGGATVRARCGASRRDVPWVSVLVSVFFALVAVGLNWLLPEALLGILLNAVGAALLVVGGCSSPSRSQAPPADRGAGARIGRADDAPHVGLPWLTWAVLVGLAALAVLMLTDAAARAQLVSTVGLVAVILAVYLVTRRGRARRGAAVGARADG